MHNKLKAEVHPGYKLTGPKKKKKKKRPWPTRGCCAIKKLPVPNTCRYNA